MQTESQARARARHLRFDVLPRGLADPETGEFEIIRELKPPRPPISDPFDDEDDPALDPSFQEFVGSLSDTEREAAIKQRMGQGLFRERLLLRWNRRCALTLAGSPEMLIAGHIKP